jgi:V/A-type H+-transporting ATPase subunit C
MNIQYERFADNFILKGAARARFIAVGAEPLVAYLQAKLTEIKVCRSIANGKAIGEDMDKTREMLRELYG